MKPIEKASLPMIARQFHLVFQSDTHEYEQGVDVIRVVCDHVFVMAQDLLLDEVPPRERIPARALSEMRDQPVST